MTTNRDEFTEKTRRLLGHRAGQRCSNPTCRRATCKADPADEANWINLGIAAHITAASPDGPRYDPTLTPEKRKHPRNGIWLCNKCAKEVDSSTQAKAYPVDMLRKWKRQAEAVTARDAAATPDRIAQLIALIQTAREAIDAYVRDQAASDPVYDAQVSKKDRDAYAQSIVKHCADTQRGYDAQIAPLVTNVLERCRGILGDSHEGIVAAIRTAKYARTNSLAMTQMASTLEELHVHLLLR